MNLVKNDPYDIIKIAKNFVHAVFDLNMQQQRILMLIFKKVGEYNKTNNILPETIEKSSKPLLQKIEITADEYHEAFHKADKSNKSIAYKALTESAIEFQKALLKAKLPNKKGIIRINYTSNTEYRNYEGKINIKLTDELAILISKYSNYVKLPFSVYKQFNNKYSLRFLMYLLEFNYTNKNWVEIKIDNLKTMLNLENKYKLFGHIKNRIIEPAIKEIAECTGLNIKTNYIKSKKQGNKIKSIKFEYNQIFQKQSLKKKTYIPTKTTNKTKPILKEFKGLAPTADKASPLLQEFEEKKQEK